MNAKITDMAAWKSEHFKPINDACRWSEAIESVMTTALSVRFATRARRFASARLRRRFCSASLAAVRSMTERIELASYEDSERRAREMRTETWEWSERVSDASQVVALEVSEMRWEMGWPTMRESSLRVSARNAGFA